MLLVMAACGGGSSRRDTSSADSMEPEPAPVTQPDTQPTKTPTVTLATDRRSYRAGDPVELRIVNETANTYSYNPCMRVVEQQSAGAWTEVKEDRICTMIAHMLEPNARKVERTELGEQLPPGTYRVAVRFAAEARDARPGAVTAYSEPITVSP